MASASFFDQIGLSAFDVSCSLSYIGTQLHHVEGAFGAKRKKRALE